MSSSSPSKPQFLVDLERDGYVVVPSVVPPSVCASFVESAWSWLESFTTNNFSRTDRSTWKASHLPSDHSKGLYNRYSVNHEAFVWNIRTQPGILETFSQIWGTDDLIASFDGLNISLPVHPEHGRTDVEETKPWEHIDQDPRTISECKLYQGIANLADNGPSDGGLVVLAGSHKLHQRHFDAVNGGKFRPECDLGEGENGYNFNPEDAAWYREVAGCPEVKVCAKAGDLILWDSRTIHWNTNPKGERTRFATYVCYCPRSFMTEEELEKKREIFEQRKGTTHWPVSVWCLDRDAWLAHTDIVSKNMNIVPADKVDYYDAKPRRPDGSLDPADRTRPFHEPEVTPEVLRLVGVRG